MLKPWRSSFKYFNGSFLYPFQGRSEGGSWGAHDPPFVSLFLRKQPTIFRGENAMTIMFDTVWPPPPFEKSWLRPWKSYTSTREIPTLSYTSSLEKVPLPGGASPIAQGVPPIDIYVYLKVLPI